MERPKETDYCCCYVDRKYNDAIEYIEALEKYADYLEAKINSSLRGVRPSLPDRIVRLMIRQVIGTWETEGISPGLTEKEGDELEKYFSDNNITGNEA